MPTTVTLSDEVKSRLERYKKREGHTSYDSAVRELLMKEKLYEETV